MHALVVGGTRFFGRSLVESLRGDGHEVTVLSRGNRPIPEGAAHLAVDRDDADATRRALAGRRFDVVFDNVAFEGRHVRELLGALGGRAGRYVLTSTASVYADWTRLHHEDDVDLDARVPDQPYADGKRAAERALRGADLPWAVVRPSVVTGPHDPTGRLERFAAPVREGQGVALPPGPPAVFQLSWYADVVAALRAAADHPGRAYNVACQELYTYETLVGALAAAAGRPSRVTVGDAGDLPFGDPGDVLALDVGRLRDILGVRPTPGPAWMGELMARSR